MKSLCLLTRRPGTTRAAFRDYYETRHCKLGMKYFPFAKYLRNHVVESSRDIDFDCVSEFYFEEGRPGIDIMGTPTGEILRADEREFMDQSLIRPAVSEESILAGPPRDVARPGSRRQLLMLGPAAGTGGEAFVAAAREWGLALGRQSGVMRVSLDRTTPFVAGAGGFPWQAVLSLWLEAGAAPVPTGGPPPAALALDVALLADVCESTREELATLYDPS
jgi:hypothetical protein